ncbi:MAG: interleukin-like EMT inducer domain-containing protein, partial [Cyclobacteriaceae bacterium]
MTTKEITIKATSVGYGAKYIPGPDPQAQISIDGNEIGFGNYSRGLNVAVFDETTGVPLFSTTFDTPIDSSNTPIKNCDIFADLINSLPTGRIVAVAVKGDGISSEIPLTDKAKAAFNAIGSDQIDKLLAYQSYTLIGIKGHQPGTAHESIEWLEASSSFSFDVEAVKATGGFVVEAISKPSQNYQSYIYQGDAQIKVNGSAIAIDGGYQPGWNVGILDRKTGVMKSSGSFNMLVPAEAEKFVEIIEELSAGEIVAIATKDYTNYQPLDQKVIKTCSSIGSSLVGKLQYGGSWVLVGYKGAKPGKAVENVDNIAQYLGGSGAELAVKYWELPTEPLKKDLKVGQKLWVNGASSGFGCTHSVSISGDYALVGDSERNKVYLYRWQNGQWQLEQELQIEQELQKNGYYGFSAISSNRAIVGAYGSNASGKICGAAYIYELKDGKLQNEQKLQPSDLKYRDYFGISVAIDGKVAIVGAHSANISGKDNCGAAYIFHLENGKWVQQKPRLQPLDLGAKDNFGNSVAIDGNVAIVGARYADAS